MTKLVGIANFRSKKGNDCYTITVLTDCNARDNEVGRFGQKAETIFLDEQLAKKVKPSDCGKEILLDYEVTAGRAYVVGLSVK